MNLSEKLELYTRFSQGENNGFSKLEVADLELVNFDLKPYDLSNSYFVTVNSHVFSKNKSLN